MKKIYTLALLLTGMTASFAQTFYQENFGAPTKTTAIDGYTGFQNTTVKYTGTADLRSTLASSGYDGASGAGNVFFTNTVGRTFLIENIDTSKYSSADLQLSFGENQFTASDTPSTNFVVEVSTNGTSWTTLSYSRAVSDGWDLITIGGGTTAATMIPSAANLRIRFTQASATIQYRIDDVKLSSVSSSCLLKLGTATAMCNGSTLGTTDTYTATIPFTGGGAVTYAITATNGTIGGDNPSTTAAGNITISGITEATNITVTVIGGTCNITKDVTGVSCKPVNTLPYYEGFDYAAGTAITSTQKWASANSGDDVVVAEGNLSYTGVTPTGKSVTFAGAGAEAYTPFTVTTTGKVFTSFLFSVTDMAKITVDGSETAVTALLDTDENDATKVDPSAYRGKIYVKKVGTQYQIGLASTGATTTNYTSTSYNVGDTVFVVVGYDFATSMVSAWINPTLATVTDTTPATLTETPATPYTSLAGFLIRQDADATTPTITFDELKIGTTLASVTTAGLSNNQIAGLKIYPNPLNGSTLNITSANNGVKAVAIYDVLGKQVISTTTANGIVNAAGLNAGVYIVKVTEEGKTATRKLVVQ